MTGFQVAYERGLQERVDAGDDAAIWEMYAHLRPMLIAGMGGAFRMARRVPWLCDDDVEQELCLAFYGQAVAWRKMPPEGRAPLAPLLVRWAPVRTLASVAGQMHRGKSCREQATDDLPEPRTGDARPVEAAVVDRLAVGQVLGELSPLSRAVVELADVMGWPLANVAAALRLHPNTVGVHRRQVLDFAARRLAGGTPGPPPDPPVPEKRGPCPGSAGFSDGLLAVLEMAGRHPEGRLPNAGECEAAGLSRRFIGRARPVLERLGVIPKTPPNQPACLAVSAAEAVSRVREDGEMERRRAMGEFTIPTISRLTDEAGGVNFIFRVLHQSVLPLKDVPEMTLYGLEMAIAPVDGEEGDWFADSRVVWCVLPGRPGPEHDLVLQTGRAHLWAMSEAAEGFLEAGGEG